MATNQQAPTQEQRPMTVEQRIDALGSRIEELMALVKDLGAKLETAGGGARGNRQSQREMTDDDARKVLAEMAGMKHNEAADKLGLSYGQVYSARLGYTFKHIRKELSSAGIKNQWLENDHTA